MRSKKAFIIISILCCNYHYLLSQSVLKGSWEGQRQIFSCWAASLSNLTKCDYNKTIRILPEEYFYKGHRGVILCNENNIFTIIADSIFNFRSVRQDSILSFSAIQYCFSYRFSRPIIYSFGYRDIPGGHFVNIYGTTLAETDNISHQKWLNIFDPKPNTIGNRYYKNYKTYSIVEPSQYLLQGTHYQFVANRFALPLEIPDAQQKSIEASSLISEDCIPQNNLRKSIDGIIKASAFIEVIGNNITYPKDSILMSRLQVQINSRSESQFVTVESEYSSFLFIPLANGKIKGGVVVDKIKENCFLIDRIENLTSFRGLEPYLFNAKRHEIFTIEHDYRFLFYQETEQSPKMIIDLDGYFGKPLEKLTIEFFFKLLLKFDGDVNVEETIPPFPIIQPVPSKRRFNITKIN